MRYRVPIEFEASTPEGARQICMEIENDINSAAHNKPKPVVLHRELQVEKRFWAPAFGDDES